MSGHLLVTARPRLREGDDPVGARLGDESCPVEELFDALARIGRSGGDLDPHQPPLVEVATDESGLLEHPDEDAHVTFGYEQRQVVRIDEPVRVPEPAVDRAELGRGGHVGDRESSQAVASLGLASRSVSLGSPSRPARPTICTYPSSESG